MSPLTTDLIRQSHDFWRRPDPHNRHAGGTALDRLKIRARRRHLNEIYREITADWAVHYPFLLQKRRGDPSRARV